MDFKTSEDRLAEAIQELCKYNIYNLEISGDNLKPYPNSQKDIDELKNFSSSNAYYLQMMTSMGNREHELIYHERQGSSELRSYYPNSALDLANCSIVEELREYARFILYNTDLKERQIDTAPISQTKLKAIHAELRKRVYTHSTRTRWRISMPKDFPILERMGISIGQETRCFGPSTETNKMGEYCIIKVSWSNEKVFTGFEFDHWIACTFINQHLEEAFNEISKRVESHNALDQFPHHENIINFLKEKYSHIRDYRERITIRAAFILEMINKQWYPQGGYCKDSDSDCKELMLRPDYSKISEINYRTYQVHRFVGDLFNVDLYMDDIFGSNLRLTCKSCHKKGTAPMYTANLEHPIGRYLKV
jgi:hypothetical protein